MLRILSFWFIFFKIIESSIGYKIPDSVGALCVLLSSSASAIEGIRGCVLSLLRERWCNNKKYKVQATKKRKWELSTPKPQPDWRLWSGAYHHFIPNSTSIVVIISRFHHWSLHILSFCIHISSTYFAFVHMQIRLFHHPLCYFFPVWAIYTRPIN